MGKQRVIRVDILVALFAIGSWVCIQGVFVELPLLVQTLPEGWTLPSILSVIVTSSNVAPITFSVMNFFAPKIVTEKRGIYLTIFIGIASTTLLSFYWKSTGYLWGKERSVALFALVFLLGMVDCSSRVLYVPFMSKFQETYLVSYFVGEGLSGFLPGAFALMQGAGGSPECRAIVQTVNNSKVVNDNVSSSQSSTSLDTKYEFYYYPPAFSVEVFFYLLLGMFVTSAIAFHLLNYDVVVDKSLQLVEADKTPTAGNGGYTNEHCIFEKSEIPEIGFHDIKLCKIVMTKNSLAKQTDTNDKSFENSNNNDFQNPEDLEMADIPLSRHSRKVQYVYLATVQLIVCLISNGILICTQTFSCLPYGDLVYHLSVSLSAMANPLVCLCLLLLSIPSPTRISVNVGCIIATVFSVYVTMAAVQSPNPPLVNLILGKIIMVISWVTVVSVFTYIKVSCATLLKRLDGKRGLFCFGVMTQVGSAVGSLGTFFLINFTTVFKSDPTCGSGGHSV